MNSNSFPQSTLLSVNRVALEVFEADKEHTGKSIALLNNSLFTTVNFTRVKTTACLKK